MKRFIYILLAGLAAAGLASCDKQDLKPSVSDIYAVEIEEDALQTKASAIEIENGKERTFYATLKKSSDGGKTYSYVSCSNWSWGDLSNCTKGTPTTQSGYKASGIISGKCTYTGSKVSSSSLVVRANGTPAGNLSKNVDVAVTPRKFNVTFNFTPNTTELYRLINENYGTQWGHMVTLNCYMTVYDGTSSKSLGSATFSTFYYYADAKIEERTSIGGKGGDNRVLKLVVQIEEGRDIIIKFPSKTSGGGLIAFSEDGTATPLYGTSTYLNLKNRKVSVSQGTTYSDSDSFAAYKISAVNSDLTINVTTPN